MSASTFTPGPSFDPAHVLGCTSAEAQRLLRGRRVTPGEVESVALQHYHWRRHVHDPDSYWVTAGQAAEILGMSREEVKRLLDEHRLAHVRHVSGIRLMRRSQVIDLARSGRKPSKRRSRRSELLGQRGGVQHHD